jgi:Asp-tRNA(Asn)/Glu-tRNA(Gln) amidotransferase A subunit family amidase
MTLNGGPRVPTFNTFAMRDPGNNADIPGRSLLAGMTRGGLPLGLEIDGALDSDTKLIGIGRAMEEILGRAPPRL